MPRATNNSASKQRKKKVLKQAKGYWGSRSKVYKVAANHVDKGNQHAYKDRKQKKRNFRKLWITRINAAARQNGISYSKLMQGLKDKGLTINRKILANLAVENPKAFSQIVKFIRN